MAWFDRLVAEGVRLLVPGGCFTYVGVHPCFVNPFAEQLPDGVRLHSGYRGVGRQEASPYYSCVGIGHRIGVHHLPLEALLAALLTAQTRIERVLERSSGGDVPDRLGVRLVKLPATPQAHGAS